MDKLQPFLTVLKKYHFWFLMAVVVFVAFGTWWTASAGLDEERAANQQKIETMKSDAERVRNVNQHPNESVIKGYQDSIKQQQRIVWETWNELYEKQRGLLVWPDELGEPFIRHVEQRRFGQSIPVDFLDAYLSYIKARFDELHQIIKAQPPADESGTAPKKQQDFFTDSPKQDPSSVAGKARTHIVTWENQDELRKIITRETRASPMWVWVVQENLWVYEGLLNIIANVNGPDARIDTAVISVIQELEVGKRAGGIGSGSIFLAGDGTGAAGAGPAPAPAAAAEPTEGSELVAQRYLDATGTPMANGMEAQTHEFKRIPVRMVLKMDSREITTLLVECANAPLTVEVQQLKINAGDSIGASGSRPPASSPTDSSRPKKGRAYPHVDVVLQGVVYIYNPPDAARIKLDLAAAEAEAAGGAPASGTSDPTAVPPTETTPPADASGAPAGETPVEGTGPAPDASAPSAEPNGAAPTGEEGEDIFPPAEPAESTPPADDGANIVPPAEAAP